MSIKVGTLIAGVALLAIGAADAFLQAKLGLPLDIALIATGAGALGVHVNVG